RGTAAILRQGRAVGRVGVRVAVLAAVAAVDGAGLPRLAHAGRHRLRREVGGAAPGAAGIGAAAPAVAALIDGAAVLPTHALLHGAAGVVPGDAGRDVLAFH